MLPIWHLEYQGGSNTFGKCVHCCIKLYTISTLLFLILNENDIKVNIVLGLP